MSQKFKSEVELQALNAATTDTDKFLVSDGGIVKYRTGAQVLSDIGGQSALTNPITGAGTTNYVSKFTGTGTLGNSQIFDNGTNVGIGTNNPSANEKLTVSGKIYANPQQPVVLSGQGAPYYGTNITLASDIGSTQGANRIWSRYDGTGSGAITFERSTNSQLYNSDPQLLTYTESMRIAGNGNVGIGTTAPTQKLDVSGAVRTTSFYQISNGLINVAAIGSQKAIFGSGGDDFTFYNPNATNNVFYTSGTERMRITSSGNVGIGTSSPDDSAILHLQSTKKGFLPPVMNDEQMNAIDPVQGLMIFNTSTQQIYVFDGDLWRALAWA